MSVTFFASIGRKAGISRISTIALLAGSLGLQACAGLPGQASLAAPDKEDAAVEASARNAALAAEAGRDYLTAAGSWSILLARHPDDPALALAMARDLRDGGRVQQAIDLAAGYLDRHAPEAGLLAELGKDYLAADRLGLAERSLRQAARLAPGDWQILSALGVALDYQGKYDEAAATYGRALAASPDNPMVLNNLGLSQAEAGRLAEAETSLARAADQPGATAQVRQNLALVKALRGDPAGAARLSRQDLSPEMARANDVYYRALASAVHNP